MLKINGYSAAEGGLKIRKVGGSVDDVNLGWCGRAVGWVKRQA
jgi:hypothetical protein